MNDLEKYVYTQRLQTANRYLRSLITLNQQKYAQQLQLQSLNNTAKQHNTLLQEKKLKETAARHIAEINRESEIAQLKLQNEILRIQLEIEQLKSLTTSMHIKKQNTTQEAEQPQEFNNVDIIIQQQADLMYTEEIERLRMYNGLQTIIQLKEGATLKMEQLFNYDSSVEDVLLEQLNDQIELDVQLEQELQSEQQYQEDASSEENQLNLESAMKEIDKEVNTQGNEVPKTNNDYLLEGLERDIEEAEEREERERQELLDRDQFNLK